MTDLGLARCFPVDTVFPKESDPLLDATDLEMQDNQRTRLTRGAVGTPLYMAPEQWQGHTELDCRTDIYAWGCLFVEVITGQQPVNGKTREEARKNHLDGQVGHIAQRLPDGIRELVTGCVAIDPKDRPGTWKELLAELERGYSHWTHQPLPHSPYRQATSKDQRIAKGWSLICLGISYCEISKRDIAIDYFQKALGIAETEQEQHLKGIALKSLGGASCDLGNPEQAIAHFEQALAIMQKIQDKRSEGYVFCELSKAYNNLGETLGALDNAGQALKIARGMEDKGVEAAALNQMGNAYVDSAISEAAINYYEQALALMDK